MGGKKSGYTGSAWGHLPWRAFLGLWGLCCVWGGGGLVCLERGVVPWMHEIDPLIGWRVRDRVPALGAFVPPSW